MPSTLRMVNDEMHQAHATRQSLYRRLEEAVGRPVLSYFTNFYQPVNIESGDSDILEGLLQTMNLTNGLALVISSPGGDGLAAERVIRVCRSYSKTGKFVALVPSKAKSAATMICMGAERIVMGPTSELGPVDPQFAKDGSAGHLRWFSVYNIVRSYEALFKAAIKAKGNLEPYLQQLAHYEAQEIAEFRAAIKLSDDIAVKALASGMMAGSAEGTIKRKIKIFIEPSATKVHGRAINREVATSCGLNIESWEVEEERWQTLYELYTRCNLYMLSSASKILETESEAWHAPLVRN